VIYTMFDDLEHWFRKKFSRTPRLTAAVDAS
jgi:hypothetical protein